MSGEEYLRFVNPALHPELRESYYNEVITDVQSDDDHEHVSKVPGGSGDRRTFSVRATSISSSLPAITDISTINYKPYATFCSKVRQSCRLLMCGDTRDYWQ